MRFKGPVSAFLTAFLGLAGSGYAKQYVVKATADETLEEAVINLQENFQAKIIDTHQEGRLILVEISDTQKTNALLNAANKTNEFAYVVENIKMHAFDLPNDPKLNQQWALEKVKASSAWNLSTGSRDVVVAVVDTGIDWSHEDLKDSIWQNTNEVAGNNKDDDGNGFVDDVRGWDFNGADNDPMDETSSRNPGHGTHCAGIVGAIGNNSVGISGMAQKVSLMPVRFLGADGSGDLMAGAKAIDYAANNGAHVISASWGAAVGRSAVQPILDAIQRAESKGVIFVAAAANDGRSNDTREVYPANAGLSNVISVAASDSSDAKPTWSNYGKATVDLSSPGANILSTLPKNGYGELSGTSMATPLVSGLVALMASQAKESGRHLSAPDYKAILQATGAKVAIETACGCRVDAEAALSNIEANTLTVVPNALTLDVNGTKNFTAIGGNGGPFTFTSSNPQIAKISENGTLTALGQGEVTLTVTDSAGNKAVSRSIYVGKQAPNPGEQCPLNNEMLCQLMCVINPELPWCK